MGFLFVGSDKSRYASTVGHCVLDVTTNFEQNRTWPVGSGPVVSAKPNADGSATATGAIGRVVFAEFRKAPDGDNYDFALIRLDRGVRASPSVRELGGPRGIDGDLTDAPTQLFFYGQADLISTVQSSRQLLATTLHNPEHVYANGPAGPGDSGAPVLDGDGRAVGLILGAGGNDVAVDNDGSVYVGHDQALNRIVRLKPVLRHAAVALHVALKLQRT
jgi:hypothetical protein